MQKDRVIGLLAAYFNQPYPDYAEVIREIRDGGGLDSEEVQLLQATVLLVDANAILRQSGTTEMKGIPASTS